MNKTIGIALSAGLTAIFAAVIIFVKRRRNAA